MGFLVQEQTAVRPYLSEEEETLAGEVSEWLKHGNAADFQLVQERMGCLRTLGEAVFGYPSIRDTEFLKGIIRDGECLAETLLAFSSPSRLLHIPTKVVALRSFLVAKFHTFSLFLYLTGERHEYHTRLRNVIISIICTLIAEDAYFSFLDDPGFARNTRSIIANDLIDLWDSGVDHRGIHCLPVLSSLLLARDAAPPSFGTLDGNTELLRISIDMENDWQKFLVEETGSDQTRWALEEFLFGLSYEEIAKIRARLKQFGVTAVGYEEINSFLGAHPAYSRVNGSDPRAIYDFFIERREACALRKRMGVPGPRLTLEESYLKYRIVVEPRKLLPN
jgi:hypothetical protein